MRQLLLDFTRAPAPTFANFVHGANAEAAHVLEAAARGESRERVIYLWGEAGAGKTHLLKAFAAAAGPRHGRYLEAAEFRAIDARGILALDDAGRLPEPVQIELFNAFNEQAFTMLVVSAGAAPRDVPMRRDLATRLATGLTYRVAPLTDPEKRAALMAHSSTRGFALAEEVAAYLLTHSRRDMGSLMAALDSLDRYSLETGRPITVPLIKQALA
ncbi:MAG TPA: DnaA regulatory inactivator Hda [Usitatibacter sp.]|jgi:DnaA family protein|nr:DnaA regulatory inactivator Hda [Usitatibacter sp.]